MRHTLQIEAMPWPEFLEWFEGVWQPGEHVSVIAPTGAGKSTFAEGILGTRRYVVVLDAKGGDGTLESYKYPRLEQWPDNKAMAKRVQKNDDDGLPSRYLIGNKTHTVADRFKLVATLKRCLLGAWEMGGWTVYADELMILTDPRQFNLRTEVDAMLIAARDKGVSFVSSYQAPSWVTPMAGKQATWVAISYTRDTDVVNRLAEIIGRSKDEIRGAIQGLEEYCWIIVGRNPREPLRVTIPDFVAPVKKEVAA